MTEKADELYRRHETDKLLVKADPTLTEAQRSRLITELTDELLQAERAAGIRWEPVSSCYVENATVSGSVRLRREETDT
jgi:hypothetical protein